MKKRLFTVWSFVIVLALFLSVISPRVFSPTVKGQTEEELRAELKKLEEELKAIQNEKNKIQDQINANEYVISGYNEKASELNGEIKIFQKEIDELQIQIKELEINILLIKDEIKKKESEIALRESEIVDLDKESNRRIRTSYMDFRMSGSDQIDATSILQSADINTYFKDSLYGEIVQSETNMLMRELARLKNELNKAREELSKKLINIDKEKLVIEAKKLDVDKRKSEIDAKKAIYFAEIAKMQNEINNAQISIALFSEEEAKTAANAEAIRNQIFGSYTPVQNGSPVRAGQMIGNQGATGLATGPHLHFIVQVDGVYQNPCNYLPGGALGCGGGGSLSDPLGGPATFTSGYGDRCFDWGGKPYCDFHNGADAQASPWNAPIYAAHNGYLYKGVDPYGALYIIICQNTNCNQGLKTGYWHLSAY